MNAKGELIKNYNIMKFRVKYPGLLIFCGWIAFVMQWILLGSWSFKKFHISGAIEIIIWFIVLGIVAGIIGTIIMYLVSLGVED